MGRKEKYTKAVGVDGSIVNPSKLEPQTQRVLKELQSEWGQMKKVPQCPMLIFP